MTKSLYCSECDKLYIREPAFDYHIEKEHDTCILCGKYLKAHKRNFDHVFHSLNKQIERESTLQNYPSVEDEKK